MKVLFGLFVFLLLLSLRFNVYSQKESNVKRYKEDIEYFLNSAESIHPDLYASVSKDEVIIYKNNILSQLSEETSEYEFYKYMMQFAAIFKDGHTRFGFLSKIHDYSTRKFFPFEVDWQNNHLLINLVYGDSIALKRGDEIISIDKYLSSDIYDQVTRCLAFESAATVEANFENRFPILMRFVFYPLPERLKFVFKRNGVIGETYVSFLTHSPRPLQKPYNFKTLEGNIGYLESNAFYGFSKRKFESFLDSVSLALKINKTSSLILDLRKGGGGDDNFAQLLMNYLAPGKTYSMVDKYQIKTSAISKRNIRRKLMKWYYYPFYPLLYTSRMARAYLTKRSGTLTDIKFKKENTKSLKNAYNGDLYLLTSSYTYSASADFVIMLLDSKRAVTTLGTQIGQPYSGFIDVCSATLPNTNYNFDVSFKRYTYSVAEARMKPEFFISTQAYHIPQEIDDPLLKAISIIENKPMIDK